MLKSISIRPLRCRGGRSRTRCRARELERLFGGAGVDVRLAAWAPARAGPRAAALERCFTSASVSRTDSPRAMTSRASCRCGVLVGERQQRARVAHRQPPAATSARTSSGSLSRRTMLATVDRSLPTARGDLRPA